jgi:hypothetical protein
MSSNYNKKLVLLVFLTIILGAIWVLNQKKNYNPVLSLKTNFSFKSDRNLDYRDLSSSFEILEILNSGSNDFSLNPRVRVVPPTLEVPITFNVIGRELVSSNTKISVFEYRNQEEALERYEKLLPSRGETIFNYKNLLVEGDSNNQNFLNLKEQLNVK